MNILCFGDSNTWGYDPRSWLGDRYASPWPEHLAHLTGWAVHNQGQNGREIPREMTPCTCDLMIVMLGTNDLLQGHSPQQVSLRMETFLKTVQMPVLFLSPPPMASGEWVQEPSLIENSHQLTREYAALANQLHICFCDTEQWRIPLCFDGVHFTESGHKSFAEHLVQYLKEHL